MNGSAMDDVEVPATVANRGPNAPVQKRARADIAGGIISSTAMWLSGALIIASVITVLVRIYARYVVNNDIAGADDVLTLMFVWLIFLGIPRSIWIDSSPRLGIARMVGRRMPRAPTFLEGSRIVLELAFFSYILISALRLLPTSREVQISTLGISETWVTMAVIVGSGLSLIMCVLRLAQLKITLALCIGGAAGIALSAVLVALPLTVYVAALIGIAGTLILDAPIAVALGIGAAAMVAGGELAQMPTVAAQLVEGPRNIALLAIPLFMLMGGLIAQSRLARDLLRFVRALFGWAPGGVGVASIATGGLFANMSGSAVADSAAIATVYTPQLREAGYTGEEAAALQASAGVVGVVFPPAIAMILYGTVANLDIVGVFKAVIVPGVLLVAMMMAITVFSSAKSSHHKRSSFSFTELVRSVPAALPALIIPVILDAGIFSGVFTPSESGAVAVAAAFVLILALRGITLRQARSALTQAVDSTTLVMFILVAVTVLDYGFTTSGLQAHISSLLSLAGNNPLTFLIIVNILFLVVHEFIETAPSILVLVPLIIPAALSAGVNPYQLGAVIAVNSTIGLVLPPVGVSLYVASHIAQVDPLRALRHLWKYVGGSLVVLTLVTVVPQISTWLPSHW